MPTWSSKELIRRLKKEGWQSVGNEGSHAQFKHPEIAGKVTIPHPRRQLATGLVRSIFRQAGWDWAAR